MYEMVKSGVSAVGDAGAGLLRQLQRWMPGNGPVSAAEPRSRWRAVTVNRSPEEVLPDGVPPAPLARLGDLVEVQVRPAPGGRGSELRARLRTTEPAGAGSSRVTGDDPRQQVRAALRESKALLEVGEVLRVDPAPHGKRTQTPAGKLIDLATKRAPGEGVL